MDRQHPTEARIMRHDAAPVQSGPARLERWIVEFEPQSPSEPDPLMGWSTSKDVCQQVRIPFDSLAEAETYCRREGLSWVVRRPRARPRRPRSYADNFLSRTG